MSNAEQSPLMRTDEVAKRFNVNSKTVARWAKEGKISCIRTMGGHRRYHRDEIERLLAESHQSILNG